MERRKESQSLAPKVHRQKSGRRKGESSDTSVKSRGVLSHLQSLFFYFLFLFCVSSQSLFSPFFFIYLIFFAKFVTSSKVH